MLVFPAPANAQSLLDRGDFQHARNSARQALELRPEVPDAAMLLAAVSLAEGDYPATLEIATISSSPSAARSTVGPRISARHHIRRNVLRFT